eukprot:9187340-Prorocentrum_lima.AAC.1
MIRDPLPLSRGKGAEPTWSAGVQFVETARHMGHEGIPVCHYVFDSALGSSVGRMHQQHHK